MFCSDDLEASDLKKGHINTLVKEAVKKGMKLMNVLKVASINPIKHYKLNVGMLRVGDYADFLIVDNLQDFNIIQTYCDGIIVAENGKSKLPYNRPAPINNFEATNITPQRLQIKLNNTSINKNINTNKKTVLTNVISVTNNRIITKLEQHQLLVENGNILPCLDNDIIKLIVLNRYKPKRSLAKCFVKGLQLKNIAIASSVAHDSHNVVAAGTNDELICNAMNAIIEAKGGIAVAFDNDVKILKLPIAGLISDLPIDEVAALQAELNAIIKNKGCNLDAPFMTLSFLTLLVIPEVKLSDKGLFNVSQFSFINNEAE
jgi:adenine deaminase